MTHHIQEASLEFDIDLSDDHADVSCEHDECCPTNREVKVFRTRLGFGRHERRTPDRRGREEPLCKRHQRAGRQHPSKLPQESEYDFEELLYWVEKMERRRLIEEARRQEERDRHEERMQILLEAERRDDYREWYEKCFPRPFAWYEDYYFECDCPSCLGLDYDYYDDEPSADWDDYPESLFGDSEDDAPSDLEEARQPMRTTEDRPFRKKRIGRRKLQRICGRRRRRQSPPKLAWQTR